MNQWRDELVGRLAEWTGPQQGSLWQLGEEALQHSEEELERLHHSEEELERLHHSEEEAERRYLVYQ